MVCSCQKRDSLPRANSQEQQSFATAIDNVSNDVWGLGVDELHSMMVIKNGKVTAERWANGHTPDELHILWSASKTFTALAVGFAVQDGLLSVDDCIEKFFSDEELPDNRNELFSTITVKHLLTMSSGFKVSNLNSRIRSGEKFDAVKAALSEEIVSQPGKYFTYNSTDSYLLSAIVSKTTGRKCSDYLNEKLFRPLGITNYIWEECPNGYNCGGWGLYLSTESLAKAGLFMLNRGEWHGRRLLSAEWFDQAMSVQIFQYQNRITDKAEIERLMAADDWNQGYGYQMWCCRNNAFRMDGAWGQFVVIIPDKNAVVVATSHTGSTPRLLNSIWTNIYPLL